MKHLAFRSLLCTLLLILDRSLCLGQVARSVLPNGLHLLVAQRRTLPLVAIDLWVRAGSAEERPEENGCAHFLEHTLFKGTTTRTVGAADEAIETLGGVLNAATGADYAHYYTEVPSSHLTEAMGILADIVRNATFPDAEVERERGVILAELAQREADPVTQLLNGLYARAFPGQPYATSPGGTPAAIRIRARDSLVSFYRRNYTPSRCSLALAGDLSSEQGLDATRKVFGDWRETEPTEVPAVHPSGTLPSLSTEIPSAAGTLPTVGIAFPAPPAGQYELACLAQLTAALLGDQEAGGSFGTETWKGTEVTVRYTPRRATSLFSILAKLPPSLPSRPFQPPPTRVFNTLADLESAIRKQIDSLRVTAPTQQALNSAKRTLLSHLQYDTETDSGLAHEIGYADLIGGETPDQLRERLQAITPAQVQQFATTWLLPTRIITLHSIPALLEGHP